MKHSAKTALASLATGLFLSSLVGAQDPTVVEDKKPNILLIVDSSGSMEYKTGENTYPVCSSTYAPKLPNETDTTLHTKSRWIDVLEVLTGPIDAYSCAAEDRDASKFIAEFEMPDNTDPPDTNFRNPYHRPLSGGCAVTPDRATSLINAYDWAPPRRAPWPFNPSIPAYDTCTFSQTAGFIDDYTDLARFGLMTFDTHPSELTGADGGSPFGSYYDQGVKGAWSYYAGTYPAATSWAQGKPKECATLQDLEVGARNGAAPASEGKMIYFGHQDLSASQDRNRHDRIQEILLATRPYGATPLNGILDDAMRFFWVDASLEPTGITFTPAGDPTLYSPSSQDDLRLSPRFDDYVECGCRQQHIILITDGEPNLDMRPECEPDATAVIQGECPYAKNAVDTIADMSAGSTNKLGCSTPSTGVNKYQILTHVVGYSTQKYAAGTMDCVDLRLDPAHADWNVKGGSCDVSSDEDLRTCCQLHRMAAAGRPDCNDPDSSDNTDGCDGVGLPYIAPTSAQLKEALGDIMKEIVGTSASATQPVPTPGTGLADNTGGVGYRILTSYATEAGPTNVWRGHIDRLRWVCEDGVATPQERDRSKGDDFAFNVANNLSDREFMTFVPDPVSPGVYEPRKSLRPHLGSVPNPNDGLGGETAGERKVGTGTGFLSEVPFEILGVSNGDAVCTAAGASSNDDCRDKVLGWTLGYDGGNGNHRCASPSDAPTGNCSVIGDIMHSTPVVVDRPRATVEDETYEAFQSTYGTRPMMAYMSSNDGIFHGFHLSPNAADDDDEQVDTDEKNNEHVAFIPPALLPALRYQYPSSRSKLLDGTPVVQDVVATSITSGSGYPFKLGRSLNDTSTVENTWRTILVQSFGGENRGYFALDITNAYRPSESTKSDASTGISGPIFLWQIITTDEIVPQNIFGTGGTPLITTINYFGEELAVAVLPGGKGPAATGSACPRIDSSIGSSWINTHYDDNLTKGAFSTETFAPRADVNCYPPAGVAANSLTIVRLDNGAVLRTFRNDFQVGMTNPDQYAQAPVPNPFLDSPISGVPAAYPAGPGMVSDRIFVGDQDGTLWRVDVSEGDPQKWTMKLFFDAYGGGGATAGKPISTAPVLSVDERGQITVAFSTGDQDVTGATGDVNYVYSLTEVENESGGFISRVNWRLPLQNGEHVLGPMVLVGGTLYFSTVDPQSGDVCTSAPSRIYGMDYIEDHQDDPLNKVDPDKGGSARLKRPSDEEALQSETAATLSTDNGGSNSNIGTVFGVSLEFVPTCKETAPGPTSFLSGDRTAVTSPSTSNLQLVFQTGGGGTSTDNLDFPTTFEAITLDMPRTASQILSWAAILE